MTGGTTRIFQWKVDKDPTSAYPILLDRIESLGGTKLPEHHHRPSFTIKMSTRKQLVEGYSSMRLYELSQKNSISSSSSTLYTLVNEKGNSYNITESSDISVLQLGNNNANTCLLLSQIYTFKNDLNFDGTSYAFGDFILTICIVKNRNGVPRGITIEATYKPLTSYSSRNSIIILFEELQVLLGKSQCQSVVSQDVVQLFNRVSSTGYTKRHTALQYVAAFNLMR